MNLITSSQLLLALLLGASSLSLIQAIQADLLNIRTIEQRALQSYLQRNKLTLEDVVSNRVVGGVDASEGSAPFQAQLYGRGFLGWQYSFMCGGSLISPRTMLTAGHCANRWTWYKVRYGTNLRLMSQFPDIAVKEHIRHPDYSSATIQNDLAVFTLEKPIQPSANVQIISLQTEPLEANSTTNLFGFGLTEGHKKMVALKLQTATLSVLDEQECKEYIESVDLEKHPGMMCAYAPGISACNGDSGGPLVSTESGNQAGIVSFGTSYCPPGSINVFTKVSHYIDWIHSNTVQ